MKRAFCPKCQEHNSTKVVEKIESFKIHGDTYPVTVHSYILVCKNCNEEIASELDDATLLLAYLQAEEHYNFTAWALKDMRSKGQSPVERIEEIRKIAKDMINGRC